MSHIEITKNRDIDATQFLARINNPHINDEFSTSCGSCHLASIESTLLGNYRRFYPYFREELEKGLSPYSSYPRFGAEDLRPRLKALEMQPEDSHILRMKKLRYPSPSKIYTPPGSDYQIVYSMSSSFTTDRTFVSNQFSIYRDAPIISNRFAHETDLALQHLRKFVFGESSSSGQVECSLPVLRACMLEQPAQGQPFWLAAEYQDENCWRPETGICRSLA